MVPSTRDSKDIMSTLLEGREVFFLQTWENIRLSNFDTKGKTLWNSIEAIVLFVNFFNSFTQIR